MYSRDKIILEAEEMRRVYIRDLFSRLFRSLRARRETRVVSHG